jgi:hypothetical protein
LLKAWIRLFTPETHLSGSRGGYSGHAGKTAAQFGRGHVLAGPELDIDFDAEYSTGFGFA